jgi:hypothetical protein
MDDSGIGSPGGMLNIQYQMIENGRGAASKIDATPL